MSARGGAPGFRITPLRGYGIGVLTHLRSPGIMGRMVRLGSLLLLFLPAVARGGLHYSGETPAELPSQWRGFLLDHRAVRLVGVPPAPGTPLHILREQYQDAATKLEGTAKT